jgi:HEAT repeat protein
MRPLQLARLYALKSVWSSTGLRSAGRALVDALDSPDEAVRTVAGMFLVQAGTRAAPLLEEAMHRRKNLAMVLRIAGDIGAAELEPALRRYAADADPEVAKAAQQGLRILAAHHGSVSSGS